MMILGLCLAATLLACLHPVLNAFALMGLGVPSTALLIVEIRRYAVLFSFSCCIIVCV